MNVRTVKWAQSHKTQSRELLSVFMNVHNFSIQYIREQFDNLPFYLQTTIIAHCNNTAVASFTCTDLPDY